MTFPIKIKLFKSYKIMATNSIIRNDSSKYLTIIEKNYLSVSPQVHKIIIGLILGYLFIRKQRLNAS